MREPDHCSGAPCEGIEIAFALSPAFRVGAETEALAAEAQDVRPAPSGFESAPAARRERNDFVLSVGGGAAHVGWPKRRVAGAARPLAARVSATSVCAPEPRRAAACTKPSRRGA